MPVEQNNSQRNQLEAFIIKEIDKLEGGGVVYYNGDTSALILADDRIVGVRYDGTVTVATGHEWETYDPSPLG